MMSFSMIIPELPEYVIDMGGEDYLGFVFGIFTVSAGLSRFWSGRLADIIGRKKIMVFGTVVTAICGGIYIFTTTLGLFLILRFIHGLSTGWRPTGSTAFVVDVAPKERMGEAMGYLGVAGSTGMAIGPALGSFLKEDYSFDHMFMASSIVGVLAMIMTFFLRESLEDTRKMKWSDLNISKGKSLDWSTRSPSIVTLLDTFSFGVVITTAPIIVDYLGFTYKGLFNLVFVSFSIVTRFIAGKTSDRLGRVKVMKAGLILLSISLLIIGFAQSQSVVVLGGAIFGISIGLNRPTIFAWSADLANPQNRAASMATMLLALEIGIGAGAFISGSIYDGNPGSISISYVCSSVLALLAFFYLLKFHKTSRS